MPENQEVVEELLEACVATNHMMGGCCCCCCEEMHDAPAYNRVWHAWRDDGDAAHALLDISLTDDETPSA